MVNLQQLFKKSDWNLEPVNLGIRTVKIPVCEIIGNKPGKTLLITGGMDGDEYAGIEAVYRLRDLFADGNFAGRLRLVPIVNVPGFEAECSQNPMDHIFPKHVYPGNPQGSPTNRLISWLSESKINGTQAWLDMHGGAITEGLRPFLWTFNTAIPPIDAEVRKFQNSTEGENIIFERVSGGSKAFSLAKRDCIYIMAESGSRGGREEKDIARHLSWAVKLMENLDMIASQSTLDCKPKLFTKVKYIYAPFSGIWRRVEEISEIIERGQIIGMAMKEGGQSLCEISAVESGSTLWWKETMAMRKGDILLAIAVK